jgi:predicted Zn-dependent protease
MLTTLSRLDEASGTRKGVPNWLSTHPAPADRVTEVDASVQQAKKTLGRQPIVDEEEYLGRIDGIVYGDSPSEGILRGNRFLHPEMRLGVDFPQGWDIQNTKTQVVAKAPEREHYVMLQLMREGRGSLESIGAGPWRTQGSGNWTASARKSTAGTPTSERIRARWRGSAMS